MNLKFIDTSTSCFGSMDHSLCHRLYGMFKIMRLEIKFTLEYTSFTQSEIVPLYSGAPSKLAELCVAPLFLLLGRLTGDEKNLLNRILIFFTNILAS